MENKLATRKKNWTQPEIDALRDSYIELRSVIDGRLCLSLSHIDKDNAWKTIRTRVNSQGVEVRTVAELKKLSYIRSVFKKTERERRNLVQGTEGGPPPQPLQTIDEQVPHSQEVTSQRSIWDRARMGKLDIAKRQRITRTMAAFLVKDMRPFSTVASENFRSMIHAIDERVVFPNSNAFSQRFIPSLYNLGSSKLIEELQSSKNVALTSDCWTSRTTIHYMTVTAHFLDDRYDLKSKGLQTRILDERHTGENIFVALNSVLQSWQIEDQVSVITTDNSSNMGRAVDISDIYLKIGCFANTLDLAAKKAVAVTKPLSKKIYPVITFLHRSHIGAKVLVEKQEALNVPKHKLITDVETRWNSTYLMFEIFFVQRVAVHATFMDKRLETQRFTETLKTLKL